MLALIAAAVFLIGLVVRIANVGFEFDDVWLWTLLGLMFLAAHHFWPLEGWRRRA